jgi:hypothetical protein
VWAVFFNVKDVVRTVTTVFLPFRVHWLLYVPVVFNSKHVSLLLMGAFMCWYGAENKQRFVSCVYLIGFCNRDGECSLRGTSCII